MGESVSKAMNQGTEQLTHATAAMNLSGCLQGFAKLMVSGLEMHQLVNVKVSMRYYINQHYAIWIMRFATVVCPTLSNPQNGRVSQQGNKPGDRASYNCNSGYELVGQSVRTCQNNGQWSGDAPTCESKLFDNNYCNQCSWIFIYYSPLPWSSWSL